MPCCVGCRMQAGLLERATYILVHGMRYLMKCHNAASRTFVVQIGEPGDYVVDLQRATGFWGLPSAMPTNRYRVPCLNCNRSAATFRCSDAVWQQHAH